MSTRSCCRLAGVLVVLAVACQREPDAPDVHAAKAAVVRYGQALVEAHHASRPDLLTGVAEQEEIARADAAIAALVASGRLLEARQTSIEFRRVDVEGAHATVEAAETWVVEYRALTDRERPAERREITSLMTYRLARSPTRWAVTESFDERRSPERFPR